MKKKKKKDNKHTRYNTSPLGRERTRRYNTSPLGRERTRRYDDSPLGRERRWQWRQRNPGK